jgi:hypothetical protein
MSDHEWQSVLSGMKLLVFLLNTNEKTDVPGPSCVRRDAVRVAQQV